MNIREDLKAFVDGELDVARTEEVRLAVEHDPALQQEVRFMKLLGDHIREEAVEPEVLGVEKALEAARKGRDPWAKLRVAIPGMSKVPSWVGWGAAFVGLLVIVSLLARFGATDSGEVASSAGPGGNFKMQLLGDSAGAASPPVSNDRVGLHKAMPIPPNFAKGEDLSVGSLPSSTPDPAYRANTGTIVNGLAAKSAQGYQWTLDGNNPTPKPPHDTGVNPAPSFVDGVTKSNNPILPLQHVNKAATQFIKPPANRKIIENGSVELEVADVTAAQNAANQIATAYGGFAENSSLNYSEGADSHATITIRVPATEFGPALARVEALGKVRSDNTTGQDVTAQYADTDARLKELNAEEDDYVTMLRGARSIGQILEIKDRMSGVKQEIASLHEQLSDLKDQSSMSTLNIEFSQKAKPGAKAPPKPEPTGSWADETYANAAAGLASTLRFLGRGAIFLFVYAPIWLPIALICWYVNWRRR